MQTVIERLHNISCQFPQPYQQKIDEIHEDIHWMLLIAGILIFINEIIFNCIIY